jgi:PKD repeat protein
MKKTIFLSAILILNLQFLLQGQTILLHEDFTTADSTTTPSGWTVQTITGDPLVDVWRFDNPGRRIPNAPISGKFACFDSDKLSNNGQAEEVYLTSPVFNATTSGSITLEFDQFYMEGYGSSCTLEVFNGTSWTSIYTNSTTTSNPHHSTLDITSQVQKVTNAQIRFKWSGNYSWYWIIDNIKISALPVVTEQFTLQTGIALTGVYLSSVAWGDYNNDGFLDILLCGFTGINYFTRIYRNNKDNTFTEQSAISLANVYMGSVAWGDYNNDGFLDVLLTGATSAGTGVSKIYRNNGNNSFTEIASLTGVYNSSVAWADYDNDGYLDILLTGYAVSASVSKVFRNNGDETFTEQTGISLTGVRNSSVAWADYDRDGYPDILLTGYTGSERISKIYRNNGDNSFTEQTGISLDGISDGSASWGDYDNDGDPDILLSGFNKANNYISKIYRNNGANTFSEQTGIILTAVNGSSADWGDYDNDGDLDIVLTGADINNNGITKIYENVGNGSFAEKTGISIPGLQMGSVKWGDYNNDKNLDILLTGYSSSGIISRIYLNNNPGKNSVPLQPQNLSSVVSVQKVQLHWDRSEDLQTSQAGLSYNIRISTTPDGSDIVSPMADMSTGLRRVVKTGNASQNNLYNLNSSLPVGTYYWSVQAIDNSFAGSAFATATFTITESQAANLKFTDITTGSMKISWVRGSRQKCVVFMKQGSSGNPSLVNNTSYISDTVFAKGSLAGDGWYCVYNGTSNNVSVTGLYGSNTYKLMVIEYSGEAGQELYLTNSNPTNPQICNTGEQFTELIGIPLPIEPTGLPLAGVSYGSVAWGDYDNDGDLDILLAGDNRAKICKIFKNNGANTFIEQTGISIPGVQNSTVAWGDYDNDGDLDIILDGYTTVGLIPKIFRNNGDNSFLEQTGIGLTGGNNGSVAWGDYDNDGDLDLLLTGNNMPGTFSKIYSNNGNNTFTEQTSIVLTGVFDGSVAWGDYDNDGDLDVLLSGLASSDYISKIYRKNSDNSFTDQTSISLAGVSGGSIAWGDYDNDGDLDILLAGSSASGYISKIYRNNGNNSFTELTEIAPTGVYCSSLAWGDYDNDGYLDILLTGFNSISSGITKIYKNNRNNSFTEQTGIAFAELYNGSVAWGDYDNDDDLDILLTGLNRNGQPVSLIYRNNSSIKNTPPSIPVNIIGNLIDKKLVLIWDKSTDVETPQLGLTYNLRIGTSPGGCEIMAPMALSNGTRTIASMGNVQHNTKWSVDLSRFSPLPEHIYYSVQAIDNGFLASEWSPEKSEISNFVADFLPEKVCQKNPVQFQDKSYSVQYPITSYQWKFTEGATITTSSLQNPKYTFQTSGTHQFELTITNSNSETTTRTKSITVLPSPSANFAAPNVCQGNPVSFDNTTITNTTIVSSWFWKFGDNSANSILEEPGSHGYLSSGDYPVELRAIATNGCSDSITKVVTVAAYPAAEITSNAPLTFCKGDSVTLSASYNINYSYRWLVNGTFLTGADSSKYIAKLSGNYQIEIVNTKANCKTTSSQVTITAQNAPLAPYISANGPVQFCQDDSVVLSVTNTPGYNYQWKLNGGGTGTGKSSFTARLPGIYSMFVSNTSGCIANSTNSVNIIVNDKPAIPTVNINGQVSFCEGKSVELSVINNPAYSYQWKIGGSPVPGATSNIYTAQNSGTYSLSVTNSNGCVSKTENVTVNKLATPSPPIISASGPLRFCRGDSVVLGLTSIPGYTYNWKLNGGAVGLNLNSLVAKDQGNYTVLVSNSNGCSSHSFNDVDITVDPLPGSISINMNGPTEFCEGDSLIMNVPLTIGYSYQWNNQFGPLPGSITNRFSVKNSGGYSVTVFNQNGCKITSPPVEASVRPHPSTPVVTVENYHEELCSNEVPIVLSVTNPVQSYSYSWKRNGIQVANANGTYLEGYLPQGDYSVVASNGGCISESAIKTIYFENAPKKPLIYAVGPNVWYLACSNDSASQYRWYYNGNLIPGADKYIYVANRNLGQYYVTIANSKGCFTASDFITIPTGATGIADTDPFAGLKIFPNPTSGVFILEIDNQVTGELVIEIFTQEGKKIYSHRLEKRTGLLKSEIELSGKPAGIYILNLNLEKYSSVRKIVIR